MKTFNEFTDENNHLLKASFEDEGKGDILVTALDKYIQYLVTYRSTNKSVLTIKFGENLIALTDFIIEISKAKHNICDIFNIDDNVFGYSLQYVLLNNKYLIDHID